MKRCLICLIALWATACTKVEEIRIPYRPVYLELDLAFEDRGLLELYSHRIYMPNDKTLLAIEKTGFGGVLVFHGMDIGFGAYQAYDAACPFEAKANTVVAVEDDIYAVCPVCGSRYDLTAGGIPAPGSASTYRLHRYNVQPAASSVGSKLIVGN
ncbi:hypothetical protein Barb4_00048 [Bacteroidales bacterium Barb4]|nr:hypothetical protein Barb4_00048 [Bacteroidales bacterium Barb4]